MVNSSSFVEHDVRSVDVEITEISIVPRTVLAANAFRREKRRNI